MKNRMLVVAVLGVFFIGAGESMAGGNVKAGKIKSSTCKTCHGSAGQGSADAPKLAGLDEAYIKKQLEDFKSGARKSKMMNMFSGNLDHMDMADLASYFSSLK